MLEHRGQTEESIPFRLPPLSLRRITVGPIESQDHPTLSAFQDALEDIVPLRELDVPSAEKIPEDVIIFSRQSDVSQVSDIADIENSEVILIVRKEPLRIGDEGWTNVEAERCELSSRPLL